MVTNSGGGYSQWGDVEITRWRSDRTRDSWGTFCYVRRGRRGPPVVRHLSSHRRKGRDVLGQLRPRPRGIPPRRQRHRDRNRDRRLLRRRRGDPADHSYQPVRSHAPPRSHELHRAVTRAAQGRPPAPGFQHAVYPDRGSAGSPRAARLPPAARRSRPARLRRASLHPGARRGRRPLRYETDRRSFIGRGRTLENPMGVTREPNGSQGYVLDPILSLRHESRARARRARAGFPRHRRGRFAGAVLGLMDKYGDPHAIDRAMDFAWASAQLELRRAPHPARRGSPLPGDRQPPPLPQPPPPPSGGTHRGEPQGAGRPVAVRDIGGPARSSSSPSARRATSAWSRQVLQAHSYWRMHGLKADLVILERGGERLRAAAAREAGGADPGALHEHGSGTGRAVCSCGARTRSRRRTCRSSWPRRAWCSWRPAAPLPQQIGVAAEVPEPPEFLARKRAPRDPSAPLPFMELPYFNGLGGFTPDGREYAIYLGPGTHTPAPWVNVMANPTFGTLVSETGSRLHLVRKQPAQPPDGVVERSRGGPAIRGAVHPRRGNRRLLDGHTARRSASRPPTGHGTGPGTRSSSTTATGSSRS